MAWFKKNWLKIIVGIVVLLAIVSIWRFGWSGTKEKVAQKVEEFTQGDKENVKVVPKNEEMAQLREDMKEMQKTLRLLVDRPQAVPPAEPARLVSIPPVQPAQPTSSSAPVYSAVPVTAPAPVMAPVPSSPPRKPVPAGMEQEEALVRQVFTSSSGVEVRRQAVQNLARYRYGRVAKVLAEKILPRDPSPIVRAEAARTLGVVGNEHFLYALQKAAANDEPEVQQAAGLAMQEIAQRHQRIGASPAPPGSHPVRAPAPSHDVRRPGVSSLPLGSHH